ncbi:deoxyguanosinetriphosphate triphosphohydrolase [Candidatus Marinamargulisbacteria bacterium SCGC AG-439-L15]|nr:deoxyguanosinetriphosphate triphosphohydrolase [Candidatus Marinamargulisbacteria bacterium SCGC AG-439-L15]
MREYFETLEEQILAPIAVKSKYSKGRQYEEPPSINRTCFQRDRDRIIHAKAFRRLKHKTQVFVALESDHYRSRLTHSIEVAQISRHIARLLRVNEDLAEAIALAHDLGHTPFGHAGEKALSEMMSEFGGFEHNQQSLRIVDVLETKYPQFPGLNLSYEVRQGLMKHTTPWDTPEDSASFVSLEAQVANLADEISYNNHDIDDGLNSGVLKEEDLDNSVLLWREAKAVIKDQYTNLSQKQLTVLINSHLISSQVIDVVKTTQEKLNSLQLSDLDALQSCKGQVVSFSKEMESKARELRAYLYKNFYMHHDVYRMNKRGQQVIQGLFTAFTSDSKLLPQGYRNKVEEIYPLERVCCDYIAGMTDHYAQRQYETLFS